MNKNISRIEVIIVFLIVVIVMFGLMIYRQHVNSPPYKNQTAHLIKAASETQTKKCPNCGSKLVKVESPWENDTIEEKKYIWICDKCRWGYDKL